jgi:hypothetical protein
VDSGGRSEYDPVGHGRARRMFSKSGTGFGRAVFTTTSCSDYTRGNLGEDQSKGGR